MKTKTIFLCASMDFYPELVVVEQELKQRGFAVGVPVSVAIMKKKHDFEVSHFKGVVSYKDRGTFIRKNFRDIAASDAILVINNTKKGMNGYIGANVLMEIAMAFYFTKKIFIWNQYSADAPYVEELACFGAVVINRDLSKITV